MEGTQDSIVRGDHMRNERYPAVPIERYVKKSVTEVVLACLVVCGIHNQMGQ